MISGTQFLIEEPELILRVCMQLPETIATASEIEEIYLQCMDRRALCIACEDGMVVFDLREHGDALELFVWIAVAFRHGAFDRQVAALHSIARELKADQIAFDARRRGWSRKLGPEWVPRGRNEFVKELT